MKEIKLTQDKTVLVDDEDFELLKNHKWSAIKQPNTFYAVRMPSRSLGKRKHIRMHCEIMANLPTGMMVDHIDGNGLNNQKNNLRIVTQRQNLQHRINYPKTSKYPGVHLLKINKKWRAQARIDGKKKALGTFSEEIDAFVAYQKICETIGEGVL